MIQSQSSTSTVVPGLSAIPSPYRTVTLRDYQVRVKNELRAALRTHDSALLVMPSRSGKGTTATDIINDVNRRGLRVVFLVNRRSLVFDMVTRLRRLGLNPGIVMGTSTRGAHLSVVVASVDTLRNRSLPPATIVFVDEARFACSPTWTAILDRYRASGAKIIGMDATPIRLDGRGLGEHFQSMVIGPSVAELTAQGDLVPARIYAPSVPDLTGLSARAGDYSQDELAAAMDKPRLVGGIVEHWNKLAADKPTVVFAVNREHGHHITGEFAAAGIAALFVDANTSDANRDAAWEDLANGTVSVVVSVGIIIFRLGPSRCFVCCSGSSYEVSGVVSATNRPRATTVCWQDTRADSRSYGEHPAARLPR